MDYRLDDEAKQQRAGSFGAAAEVYERARPGYPREAVDWLVPAAARTVLDLGAGTGKFTRLLAAEGRTVIAVEPSEGMLDQLRASAPGVEAHLGTAERIPVAESSVDVVTAAQAWHWVDPAAALPEVARILRPGGTLALVWNDRDESVDWVHQLTNAMTRSESTALVAALAAGETDLGPLFGEVEQAVFDWELETDRAGILALEESRSYFITQPPEVRERMRGEILRVLDEHPDLRGRDVIRLPYRTWCFRAVKR